MPAAGDENPCGGPTGFITLIVLMFVMLMLFDPNLGDAISAGMGVLMAPFTFGDQYPMWTIFISGVILIIITSLVRHKFTDWYDMAKTQKISSEFNKELRDATLSGNTIKQKKLQEMQPEILKLTNKLMFGNLKIMIFTMLFAILIWRWLFWHLNDVTIDILSLPWEPSWPMTAELEGCLFPFPYWIAIYFVVSVPLGQVLISLLKVMEFSKEARVAEMSRVDTVQERLDGLSESIRSASRDGVSTMRVQELKTKIESAIAEREFESAERLLNEAEEVLDQNAATRKRTVELISTVETMINSASERNVDTSALEPILANAKAALARHDYTKAIYYSKQCQQKLKGAKEKHLEAEEALRDIQKLSSESQEAVSRHLAQRLQAAEVAMKKQKYDAVLDNVKVFKGELDSTQKGFEAASAQLKTAKELRDALNKLAIEITKIEDVIRKAEDKFNLGDYSECAELAKDATDELIKLKKLYEEASESVSFAKLVVANAANFGADVTKAESLVSDAEMALSSHDYSTALSKATTAKNIAEDAKRQIQRQEKRSKSR